MKIAIIGDPHIGEKRFRKQYLGQNSWMLKGYQAWLNACDLVVQEQADAVLICGDLFHQPDPGVHDHQVCMEGLNLLLQAQVEVEVILGNHDQNVHHEKHGLTPLLMHSPLLHHHSYEWGRIPMKNQVQLDAIPWNCTNADTFATINSAPNYPNLIKMMLFHGSTGDRWEDCGVIPESAFKGYRWIICGHNHIPYSRNYPDCTMINPGSIMPSEKADGSTMEPSVWFIDTETEEVTHIKIPNVPRTVKWVTKDPNQCLQQVQQDDVVQIHFDGTMDQVDQELLQQAHQRALHLHLVLHDRNREVLHQVEPFWEQVQQLHPEWYQDFYQISKGMDQDG